HCGLRYLASNAPYSFKGIDIFASYCLLRAFGRDCHGNMREPARSSKQVSVRQATKNRGLRRAATVRIASLAQEPNLKWADSPLVQPRRDLSCAGRSYTSSRY